MEKRNRVFQGILAGCCLLVIIFDGKTAVSAMGEGIELCVQTVIPALFPFFVLSGLISCTLLGMRMKPLRLLSRLCRIPRGSEAILLVGLLSGYPVGAQLVTEAYQSGAISKKTAQRMLGFCSNAGPAFIFGMLPPLFYEQWVLWLVWAIHIASALLVGWLLPGESQEDCVIENAKPISISQALYNAVKNIALVCGWVMIFRVIVVFCNRWFLWLFTQEIQVLFSGLLELSNGCILLHNIPLQGTRFLLVGLMLSFGGFCVMLQTSSVTQDLGLGSYFPGKVLQTFITLSVSCIIQPYIFTSVQSLKLPAMTYILILTVTLLMVFYIRRKKVVAFPKKMLYNTGS